MRPTDIIVDRNHAKTVGNCPRSLKSWETLILLPNSGSFGTGQVESLKVRCPGPVQGLAGVPGVEPDYVDGGRCGEVFQPGFVHAQVAGAADAGDVGRLMHGALDAGAGLVAVFPLPGVLPGAGGGDGLVDLARAQEQLPPGPGRGGALVPGGTAAAGGGGEPDADRLLPVVLAHRLPFAADSAFGAGGLAAVPVDGECLLGVPAGAGLGGGIGQQRAGQGDAS